MPSTNNYSDNNKRSNTTFQQLNVSEQFCKLCSWNRQKSSWKFSKSQHFVLNLNSIQSTHKAARGTAFLPIYFTCDGKFSERGKCLNATVKGKHRKLSLYSSSDTNTCLNPSLCAHIDRDLTWLVGLSCWLYVWVIRTGPFKCACVWILEAVCMCSAVCMCGRCLMVECSAPSSRLIGTTCCPYDGNSNDYFLTSLYALSMVYLFDSFVKDWCVVFLT